MKNGFNAISISVDVGNPALRLYKRLGAEIITNEDCENTVMLLKI